MLVESKFIEDASLVAFFEIPTFLLRGTIYLPIFFVNLKKKSITLAIGLMKTDEQWLDRFVLMEQKWIEDAKGWVDYMKSKYPICGKLDKWEEDPNSWPELTEEEKEAINKCIIM